MKRMTPDEFRAYLAAREERIQKLRHREREGPRQGWVRTSRVTPFRSWRSWETTEEEEEYEEDDS